MNGQKVSTGTPKLDEILEGGIPAGHLVILSGAAGTMKSTLGYSILHHNALKGTAGLYITAEQSPASISAQMEKLGLNNAEARKRIFFYDAAEARHKASDVGGSTKRTWESLFKGVIEFEQRAHGVQALVFDSLNIYEVLTEATNPRLDLFEMFHFLRSKKLTTLAIAEVPSDLATYAPNHEDFMADGIIHLRLAAIDEVHRQLRICVPKMRGVKHPHDYFALDFSNGQFQVLPLVSE